MIVTGAEWRDLDPHEGKFPPKHPRRRAPAPAESDEEDSVEIHVQCEEETSDGLDEFDEPSQPGLPL